MGIFEYDCSSSVAVAKIAFDKVQGQLFVRYTSGEENYIYYLNSHINFDELERLLISDASKGKVLSLIKKLTAFRKITYFPSKGVQMYPYEHLNSTSAANVKAESRGNKGNVKPNPATNAASAANSSNEIIPKQRKAIDASKKKTFPDYSDLWLEMLEGGRLTKELFEQMLDLLDSKCHYKFPPSVKPPVPETGNTDDTGRASARAPTNANEPSRSRNAFEALTEDDDNEALVPVAAGRLKGLQVRETPTSKRPIQTRYLIIKILCGIAEFERMAAVNAQKAKDFNEMKEGWEAAFNTLKLCRHNTDERINTDTWYAILLDQELNGTLAQALPDKHDKTQLQELLFGYNILCDNVEEEKRKAINFMTKRLQYNLQKLNPALVERDQVKQKVGEYQWTHNDAPKLTYAEKRKAWEEEVKVLTLVLESLEGMNFLSLKFNM